MTEKHGLRGAYKLMLIIPVLMLVLSVGYLAYGYSQTGEWFQRSIDLKGGTLITVNGFSGGDVKTIEGALKAQYGSVIVRELSSFSGMALTVEVSSDADPDSVLETLRAEGVDTSDASVETIGSSLGEAFWSQAQISLIVAFILMGIIVFILFRTFVPSMAVIIAAASDLIVTLALMQVFGIQLSLAAFAALLMLIGYSIDTDILLTTRVLKTEGQTFDKVKSAFKTATAMTGTTLGALTAIILTTTSSVLFSIAAVLIIGLVVDMANTWLQNAAILMWYSDRRKHA